MLSTFPPCRWLVLSAILISAARPAQASLVSGWSFDGTTADAVGGNDGVFFGGRAPVYVTGHDGRTRGAIAFDGADDLVNFPTGRGLPVYSTAGYSIAFWVKGSPQRTRVVYVEGFDSTRARQIFSLGPDSRGTAKLEVNLRDNSGVALLDQVRSTGDVFDGEWHCVVWTDRLKVGALYIDGARDATRFDYRLVDGGTPTFGLAAVAGMPIQPDGCCFFAGAVDDVLVYDNALSEADVGRICPLPPPPCTAVTVTGVDPALVPIAGGTSVLVTAKGLQSDSTARVGGLLLLQQQIVRSPTGAIIGVRGLTPALAAGFHDLEVLCGSGAVAGRLVNGLEAAAPPDIISVSPTEVLANGSTRITILGEEFREGSVFKVGTHVMTPEAVESSMAIGLAPALVAGEGPGPRDVSVEDSRGRDVLPSAVTYVLTQDPCSAPRTLTSVMPNLVPTAGGTVVEVHGTGLRSGDLVRIGGKPLSEQVLIAPRGIEAFFRGMVPELALGFHDADLLCATGKLLATLPRAVEAAAPPALKRVVPSTVSTKGGTKVTVEGANLRAVTVIKFGTNALRDPVAAADGASITGYAPPLAIRIAGGILPAEIVVDVTAEDSRGRDVLLGGVTYIRPPVLIPGPQEVETSLAEGTARFSWVNPVAYDQIEVLDENDNVIQVLAGNATSLEMGASGRSQVRVKLKGKYQLELSTASDALASLHQCVRPAPLMWGGEPCNFFVPDNPEAEIPFCARTLPVDGGYQASPVTRCTAAPDGQGGAYLPDPSAIPYVPRTDGGGGSLETRLSHGVRQSAARGRQRGGGGAKSSPSLGYMLQNENINNIAIQASGNKLITGFILEQPSDRLEIAGYYEKLATAFGLELRCRLIHVFPADGFQDEFTFPDVPIHAGRMLNSITYFRADKDIGHAGDPDDPDPANQPPKSCQLQIPAGEYRLELYAVGGSSKVQYYTFNTDQHDNEILIQGVPCPPYPLVKITDLTGIRTLPDIIEIEAELPSYTQAQKNAFPCDGLRVRYTAHGLWLDEQNNEHLVPPVAPSDQNSHFEYKWTVHDRPNPTTKTTYSSPVLEYCVSDWGCYLVDIEVIDKQCGFSKKRSYEVPIVPPPQDLGCPNTPFTFRFPTPDPGGMYGVVGLKAPNAPSGPGLFEGTRPVEFRVLVVPQCYCAETNPCPAACLPTADPCPLPAKKVEFRLAWKNGSTYTKVQGVEIQVEDLCPNVTEGAKYFMVRIEDLGKIPPQGWTQKTVHNVFMQGRQVQSDPNAGWRNVGETDNTNKALKLFEHPSNLDSNFWNGHFLEGDQSYHFVSKTSDSTEQNAPIGPSNELDLGLPAVDVSVPSYDNNASTGFTSRFMMLNGVWGPEVGAGSTSGEVVSNKMDGQPFEVEPSVVGGGGGRGGGDGSGGALDVYEWCRGDEILNESISQTLFESIIYTGTIWIIPVTIWGRIGLGLDLFIASHALIRVSPFGPLEGGPFAQAEFSLDSSVKLSIPCEISCDILGGVLSIALRLIPSATFLLKANVGTIDASPHVNFFAECFLDLLMQIEGCLDLLITEACITFDIPILEHETLITTAPEHPCFDIPSCDDDDVPITPCGGGGGAEAVTLKKEQIGGGAGVVQFELPYQSISAPVTVFSPDKKSLMELSFNQNGVTSIQINGSPAETSSFGLTTGDFLNPAATFVSNTAILVAWTEGFCSETGLPQCFPDPENPPPPATLAQLNLMQAQQEIVLSTIAFKVQPPFVDPRWILQDKFRIADLVDEVPSPADRRVDGMAAIAADLSHMSNSPPGGEAIVAWVRYEGDFLKLDGTKTIYSRLPDGQTQSCPREDPSQGTKLCRFTTQTVANNRPQMEVTAIYVRRVSLGGVIAGEEKLKISPPGINIEPAVALSPSGAVGYCVWVHDPSATTGHTDLSESNLGRQLVFATYSGASNTWSAPASVLPNIPDYDSKFPGVLEPHMALKDDLNGLLAFTAVKSGGPSNDSGLAGSRYVYGCRLVNGVFGTPFLIHGTCLRRIYGWKPQVVIDVPEAIDPRHFLHIRLPEEVIIWQNTGPAGLLEGSGNVMVAPMMPGMDAAAPAQALYNDGNIHSNVTGAMANGMLCTMNLNSGIAELGFGGGQGGGLPRSRGFETKLTRLEPDLAIVACRLSDPFSAPGSRVTAFVDIENLGLGSTPLDDAGKSVVKLEALFIDAAGRERVADTTEVRLLLAGEAATEMLHLEMPHEPVRVRVRLNPNPIDSNPDNNSLDCVFGAPAPANVVCEKITVDGEPPVPANKITWTNTGLYDEVWLYRNGSMFASLPGGCSMYIDLSPPEGTEEYCVRGRMGASKSLKTAARCVVPGVFRRGFINDDTRDDISDDVTILGYLFLGRPTSLACEKAADNNDDGRVDLSDAVYHLAYKFLGGPPPARPYESCGTDPTGDRLTCERGIGCQ